MVVGLVVVGAGAAALAWGPGGSDGWGDESRPATQALPDAAPPPPGFSVALSSHPLLVEDRLRVTGEAHGIAAAPISAPAEGQAHWTYARPEDDLISLVLATSPAGGAPVVIGLWDDGGLTALDAGTGEPAWRVRVADESAFLAGSFDPAALLDGGLLKVSAAEGGDVAIVQADDTLVAVDASTGTELWRYDAATCDQAPAPFTSRHWWTMVGGGDVVIDTTCEMPDARLEVLDPRTGETSHELSPNPPWRSTVPGEEGGIRSIGCRTDGTACSLVEHHPTGSTAGLEPVRWFVEAGRLVELSPNQSPPAGTEGLEARPNGEFELFGISRATGDVAWTMTGEARDLRRPQVFDAVATSQDVWVASHSWNGGPPALVRLSATDGSLTGCQAPPTEQAPTHVRAPGNGLVVVSDLPVSRTVAYDPSNPDGTVRMVVPDLQPACPPT